MKKHLRVLLKISVVIIILLAVWCVSYRVYWQVNFDRRVNALRAEGFPVSLDDLEALHVLPEGEQNAADVYIEAFSHYQGPSETEKPWLPYGGDYILPQGNTELPKEVMEAISTFLERNHKTIELLEQACRFKQCLWPKERDQIWLANERFGEMRDVLYLLQTQILFFSEKRQASQAYESLNTSIALAESIQGQSSLIDHMVQLALKNRVQESLCEVIKRLALNEKQLVLLQSELAEMQGIDDLYEALVVDRICAIEFWQLPYREQGKDGFNPPSPLPKFINWISGMIKRDANLSLDHLEGYLKASRLPLHQRPEGFLEVEAQKAQLSFLHVHLYNSIGFSEISKIELRAIGCLRCAETAMAIERYWLKNDSLPESLKQLVPEFLAAVPLDPLDGKPLRYVRYNDGYTVYTIGEDGVDNGGLSMEQIAEGADSENPDQHDWPFTVRREEFKDD